MGAGSMNLAVHWLTRQRGWRAWYLLTLVGQAAVLLLCLNLLIDLMRSIGSSWWRAGGIGDPGYERGGLGP